MMCACNTGWNDKIVVLKKTTLQLYFKTFIEKSLNIVSLSDMIEGSYRSCDLYTAGQLVDALQQKKKTGFH